MKRFLLINMLIWIGFSFSGYGDVEPSLDKEHEVLTVIEVMIPPLLSTWDSNALMDELHPDVRAAASKDSVDQLFFRYKTLGRLQEYDVQLTELSEQKTIILEKYGPPPPLYPPFLRTLRRISI